MKDAEVKNWIKVWRNAGRWTEENRITFNPIEMLQAVREINKLGYIAQAYYDSKTCRHWLTVKKRDKIIYWATTGLEES